MRAARFHGRKDIRVDDVALPELTPGKALVEVEWCGICGSDLHEYLEGVSTILLPLPNRQAMMSFARCTSRSPDGTESIPSCLRFPSP
jgi:threonine dehydrogenase-like Zn-dependent dehydrogenase